MLLCEHELHRALSLICFTEEQRLAIETVYHEIMQNDDLKQVMQMDVDRLADLQGPDELAADPSLLAHHLGKYANVYPALILLSRVSWLQEQYARLGIAQHRLRDALSDIPLWMTHYTVQTGHVGLAEYRWLTNHLRMKLFRLGRLEYIFTRSRVPAWFYGSDHDPTCLVLADGGLSFNDAGDLCAQDAGQKTVHTCKDGIITGYPIDESGHIQPNLLSLSAKQWHLLLGPGDPVLDVHIPEGPPMDPVSISASLMAAIPFYQKHLGRCEERAFTCGSWLMSPVLQKIVPNSNLAAFQRRFRVVPYTLRDNQVFERVYRQRLTSWQEMPMDTRLQRGVRDWYCAGGRIPQMQGVILRRAFESAGGDGHVGWAHCPIPGR